MGCPARLGHNEAMNPIIRCLAMAAMGLCLSACKPPVAHVPPPAPGPSPQERLAAIDMAAGVDDTELDVQPLRDPRIGDLREHAAQARVRGDAGAAAAALDQALQLAPVLLGALLGAWVATTLCLERVHVLVFVVGSLLGGVAIDYGFYLYLQPPRWPGEPYRASWLRSKTRRRP